jgi:hypothetical protein
MNRYLIERTIPGAGRLSADEREAIAGKSNAVLAEMAPRVQWVQSYVSDDAFTCVYLAEDAESVVEHAERGGFPADSVRQVHHIVDPTTAGD